MSIIRNSLGFSLPEITVALGLMGGISLVTMKIMDEQRSNQAYIKGRAEISKAVSLIKNTLNKEENCRQTLAGHTLTTPGSSNLNEIRVNFTRAGASFSQLLLRSNQKYSDFETETIRIVREAGAPEGVANLEMNFRIKSRNFKLWKGVNEADPDDRTITERLPMVVRLNGSNVITDCSPALSETNIVAKKKFCDSLGAAASWDNVANKCVFEDMRCPFGEVLTYMDKLGGGTCMRIENTIDLNSLFSSTECNWTGSVRIINYMGKLQVQCN